LNGYAWLLGAWGESHEGFLLVPESVVYLVDSLFSEVGAVDSLGVVVRDACDFGRLGDGAALVMDEPYQLTALVISNLHVLSHHFVEFSF
jgi:hypothetical protein